MKPLLDAGAQRADSPAAVASAAEIVLASLPTPPIVQAVALGPKGIIEGTRVKIFIDTSTTGASYEKRVAQGLAAKNIVEVDAPVSGGLKGARMGTLAVMVSCGDETFARIQAGAVASGKAVSCRQAARPGPDHEAAEQSFVRNRDGHRIGSGGDGREGGARPAAGGRLHQRGHRERTAPPKTKFRVSLSREPSTWVSPSGF